ncbi:phage tail tape measure protein [Streptomyces sp. NPDC088789]|uniref:phage tail tape measure protein n=1 Tax=Streptomyces sp. NPDC088789 TaxID=3365899 RepID=UPI0038041441
MTILEELLVRLGVDISGAAGDVGSAADRIDQSLDDVERNARGMGNAVSAAADDTAAALDQVAASAQGVEAEAEQAANGVEGALGGIGAQAAGMAVGALFMAGLQSAMDLQTVEAGLQNSLGLTEAEAGRAGDAAGRIYSEGFGASVQDVGAAIDGVASSMGGLGSMTTAELDRMTRHAMVLSQTLGVDVADAAAAAGQMIRTGMAEDGEDAFDILTQAAAALPKSMRGDIPDVMAEYGKHFQRLGIDGRTAFGLLSQYVQAGGRDIDQAADVIHEFARITSEETDRAAGAFKALGLDSGQMLTDIGRGGDSAESALTQTLTALRGVRDPAQQAALGVQLFGDMAGEGADALWAMDPATAAAATGMDQAAGAADRATEATAAAQSLTSIWRTMATTLGSALLPVLQPLAQFLSDNPALVQALAVAILVLAAGIGGAVIAQWAWNTALWAFPGTWIIAAILAVIVILVLLWQNSETFRDIVMGVWAAFKFAVGQAVSGALAAIGWLAAVPGRVAGWFTSMKDLAVAAALGLVAWLLGLPGRVTRAVSGLFDGIPASARGAINTVIGWWNQLAFTIGGGSVMGVDIPSATLNTPDIPYLARGGIATGPTVAMVGEGREDEAILPLSRLEQMLSTPAPASAPSTGMVAPAALVLRLENTSDPFLTWLSEQLRVQYGGASL